MFHLLISLFLPHNLRTTSLLIIIKYQKTPNVPINVHDYSVSRSRKERKKRKKKRKKYSIVETTSVDNSHHDECLVLSFSYLVCAVLASGRPLPCPKEAVANPLIKISAVSVGLCYIMKSSKEAVALYGCS